ncbi:hypothetical protein K8I61_13940 [bacterium]|nr:hypothetical protein [bacterium]
MASWTDSSGLKYAHMLTPALWTPTRQSFAARVIENLKFFRSVKSDFVRGASDTQTGNENDGGFILHVAASTPTGSAGSYRTLADKDDYAGTLAGEGFLNRYVTAIGSFMFLDSPANALPGGSNEGLLISNLAGSDGGDVKPLFGTWYTGLGASRPISGGSTRVFQKSGTYNGGADNYDLAFFAGATGSEDDGRFVVYENAPHGVALQALFVFSPRFEQS